MPHFLPGNRAIAFTTLQSSPSGSIENVGLVRINGEDYLIVTHNNSRSVDFYLK
jgi:hypothetical protein